MNVPRHRERRLSMGNQKSFNDIASGLIFIGIGIAFGYAASGYQIGTALRMGPGYFPLVLAGLMCILGIAIVVKGMARDAQPSEFGIVPWRGMVLLLGAIAFFGFTIRGLGLVPSLFVALLMASLASRRNTLLSALVLATSITALCVVIFIYGLSVPIALFGPWLPL
ncbi:tripartite tricarboxylate transporter TctB family protein [Georhizobium sp. MAB10]|uniref:tripartite tricarboxylate transporter TctB family protein n=1 Tax=Georhizobium sp. MAB10 TaxID=3028319 RepID=UPI0038559B69